MSRATTEEDKFWATNVQTVGRNIGVKVPMQMEIERTRQDCVFVQLGRDKNKTALEGRTKERSLLLQR